MAKKNQIEQKEFVIFSQYGFFVGFQKGGQPLWSLDQSQAKPFSHLGALSGLQRIVPQEELLIEYI